MPCSNVRGQLTDVSCVHAAADRAAASVPGRSTGCRLPARRRLHPGLSRRRAARVSSCSSAIASLAVQLSLRQELHVDNSCKLPCMLLHILCSQLQLLYDPVIVCNSAWLALRRPACMAGLSCAHPCSLQTHLHRTLTLQAVVHCLTTLSSAEPSANGVSRPASAASPMGPTTPPAAAVMNRAEVSQNAMSHWPGLAQSWAQTPA